MSPFEIVLKGVLMPMAAGLVPLVIGMRLWRRDAPAGASGWGLAVAVAITFALALWVQDGNKLWELRQKWQWLWVLAGATAAAGVVIAAARSWWSGIPQALWTLLAGAAAGTVAVLLLKPPGFDAARERMIEFAVVAGAAWLAAGWRRAGAAAETRGGDPAGWSVGIAFWLAASGLSGVVLASGFAKLAIPLGGLAALSMAAAVLSLRGRRELGFAGVATLAATLGAAAVVGWAYDDTEIPAWSFLAMALAPSAMRIPLPKSWRFAVGVRLAIVLIVVGAAGGTGAIKAGLLEPAESEAYEYDYGFDQPEADSTVVMQA